MSRHTAYFTDNNNFFTRLANPFMPFKHPIIAYGLGYLSYLVSYNLLQKVNSENAWLASHTASFSFMGWAILTAINFFPYTVSSAINLLCGASLGLVLSKFVDWYMPSYMVAGTLNHNALQFGLCGFGAYWIIYIWKYPGKVY